MIGRSPIRLAALAMLVALTACGQPEAPVAASEKGAAPAPAAADVTAERYYGLYGDPASPEQRFGQFFVTEARPPRMAENFPEIPANYLMIGAVWADVAPSYMKPLTETRFEQDYLDDFTPAPLIVEFELDGEGRAVALTFENIHTQFGRRARLGDLPEELR